VAAIHYGQLEIDEVLDSLKSGFVTMGRKVQRFEEMWASYIGVKHAIMTNSGSSANLLALSALGLPKGSEVITPALTWATTVFPIAQLGLVPVLVDVELETYNMDIQAVAPALTSKTSAIMPVHLLGRPAIIPTPKFRIAIIEDACEAHGAEWGGRKAGSFGDVGTFSLNFSHHISTIEGGMVVTSDDRIADTCRSVRSFGWTREMADKAGIAQQYPAIDPRFLFAHAGYNFKPTELAGAMGIHQMSRLEPGIAARRQTAAYWNETLSPYKDWLMLPQEQLNTRHVWFAYPICVKAGAPFTAEQLKIYLESKNVETRPIEAGNIALQPAMKELKYRVSGTLDNATYLHHNAFFIGCHPGVGAMEREAVAGYLREFMEAL
jgi:CDP-6-deoxy-D-xylo-4-hexulose-3-dehydrase